MKATLNALALPSFGAPQRAVGRIRWRWVALAAAVTVGGCANLNEPSKRIEQAQAEAIKARDDNRASATTGAIVRSVNPRLAGEEIVLRSQHTLPAVFQRRMVYATQGAQSLSEVLEGISQIAGIPIRSSEIARAGATGASGGGVPGGLVPPPGGGAGDGSLQGRVQLQYSGTLRGLLDEIAGRNDASWRYNVRTNSLEFFRFESKTLTLSVPAGPKSVSAAISLSGVSGGSGGGGGGSGAGNVAVSQNLTVNPWAGVMSGIQSILNETDSGSASGAAAPGAPGGGAAGGMTASGGAGRAAATPELGIITVTARPRALERITSYVESINTRFAQNVLIDIKVYSVTLSRQASLGFSLDAVYSYLNRNGLSVAGPSPLQPSAGTPGQLTIQVNDPTNRLAGSTLVAQALSQFGDVALQTQGQVLAVNGQPSPIQVANEVNYLASSSLTQTPNVGATTTLTPGTRVVGFTANFLPLILDDNRILLQYQLQLSSLTALTQAVSGTSSIQTPQISSQSLQQQAYVRDGQSIVLFGFDQTRDTTDTAMGIGGASRASGASRQMVVIVMQVNGGNKNA